MSTVDLVFPEGLSYGTRAGTGFQTLIQDYDSGAETRATDWSNAFSRGRYDVSKSIQTRDDYAELLNFYRLTRGGAKMFRFWDPGDWSTAAAHTGLPNINLVSDFSPCDPPFGPGRIYKLRASYPDSYGPAGKAHLRRIFKPMRPGDANYRMVVRVGGVRVYTNGLNELAAAGIRCAVDYDRGLVIFNQSFSGALVDAAFTYHIPAAFGEDSDEWFAMSWDEADQFNGTCTVEEIADPAFEGPGEKFGGGATVITPTTNPYQINSTDPHHIVFSGHSSPVSVWMPDVSGLFSGSSAQTFVEGTPYGGPHFVFEVASGAPDINIRQPGGISPLNTVTAGNALELYYINRGTGTWITA